MTQSMFLKKGSIFALGIGAIGLSTTAFAHHPLGGMTPSSVAEGLLSGIGHPVIGLDHLAFIIAAGLLAWKLGKPLQLLAAFVATTVVGSLAVSFAGSFSFKEPLILLSVALVGLLLIRRQRLGNSVGILFYSLAGLLHGSAYGEAIVGAEMAPIFAYLIGFVAIQCVIALAAAQLLRMASKGNEQRLQYARLTGAVVLGIAATYGFEIAETAMFGQV
ncbi:MAG: HupE/UreJ family protein [Cellvibrionaceae bacterium]|nr:HupE/UreJ family protein [Cellvibrionaceae bacterium]